MLALVCLIVRDQLNRIMVRLIFAHSTWDNCNADVIHIFFQRIKPKLFLKIMQELQIEAHKADLKLAKNNYNAIFF